MTSTAITVIADGPGPAGVTIRFTAADWQAAADASLDRDPCRAVRLYSCPVCGQGDSRPTCANPWCPLEGRVLP